MTWQTDPLIRQGDEQVHKRIKQKYVVEQIFPPTSKAMEKRPRDEVGALKWRESGPLQPCKTPPHPYASLEQSLSNHSIDRCRTFRLGFPTSFATA